MGHDVRIIFHEEVAASVARTPAGDVHISFIESDRTEAHTFPFGADAANELAESIKLKASGLEMPDGPATS